MESGASQRRQGRVVHFQLEVGAGFEGRRVDALPEHAEDRGSARNRGSLRGGYRRRKRDDARRGKNRGES